MVDYRPVTIIRAPPMPLVIKPRTLSLLHRVERRPGGPRLLVTVLASFDLAAPARLESEQVLWPMAAAALPKGTLLDAGLPKPRAELLVGGRVQAPHASELLLEARLATLHWRMAVFGDRWWDGTHGRYVPTAPRPIGDLLLSPERAFGGPGHPENPAGLGHGAADRIGTGAAIPLPNLEHPDRLIQSLLDTPPPAPFGPLDIMDPRRQRLAGTYDAAWLRDLAPGLAADMHPDFFLTAPEAQRLPGYLVGNEAYSLHNFTADQPLIEGRLPGVVPRAFLGQGEAQWREVALHLDTVWLLAGARRGVLIWHGVAPVADMEARDVTDLMLAYERLGEARPISHYAQVRRVRRDPALAPRFAFSEGQLTPPRDAAEAARRDAARRARAQEGAALRAEAMAFVSQRAMDEVGLPPALRPPPPSPESEPLLLPTPAELAEGDFDLGDLLDAMDAQARAAEAALEAARQQGQPVLEAMDALRQPGAGAGEMDGLLRALAHFTQTDMGASIDTALGPAVAAAGGAAPSPDFAATLDQAADWRALAAAMARPDDEAAALNAALARFFQLPEARPLASIKATLSDALARPAPALPGDITQGPAPTAPPSVLDILAELAAEQAAPGAAAAATERLGGAEHAIAQAFPALAPAAGETRIDALIAQFATLGAPAGDVAPAERLGAATTQLQSAAQQVDEAEAPMMDALATLRRAAPTPAYPEQPFSPHVAQRLGAIIAEEARAGLDLRGRDMAGADLSGADLSGCDLSGCFLERANLAGTRLVGADLSHAVLTEARLEDAVLAQARLAGANFCGINGHRLILDGADLSDALILDARLAGARAHGARLRDVRLMGVTLAQADFTGATFEKVMVLRATCAGLRLDHGRLSECQWVECDLTGASLCDAYLDRCAFVSLTAPGLVARGGDLRGAAFTGATKLAGADFSHALAAKAGFFGADLSGARFSHAVCDRALFGEAALEGADFRFASLRRATLDHAALGASDFTGAQMMEAQLHRADLKGASLRKACLYSANLSDAALVGADFTGCELTRSTLAVETGHA